MAKKTVFFGLRLDKKTEEALKLIAEAHERDRADVVRFVIRREAERVITNSGARAPTSEPARLVDGRGSTGVDRMAQAVEVHGERQAA